MVVNGTMAIRGQFKDGIPVPNEVSSNRIVNVTTKEFPIQLKFEISTSERSRCGPENLAIEGTSSISHCPIFHPPMMSINASAAKDHKVVSGTSL